MTKPLADNRSLIQKADLMLSDIATANGLLQPAKAKRFIKILSIQSVLMGLVTVRPMAAQAEIVNKIQMNTRVLHPGQEGVPLAQADRAKPSFGSEELTTKLFKGEVNITNEVMEDNIEQDTLEDTVMGLILEGVARDLEELMISGD